MLCLLGGTYTAFIGGVGGEGWGRVGDGGQGRVAPPSAAGQWDSRVLWGLSAALGPEDPAVAVPWRHLLGGQ